MRTKLIITLSVLTALGIAGLSGCQSNNAAPEFSGYRDVADLATVECYYHNVAIVENEGDDFLFGIPRIGYKKAWFEYRGSVDLGIDVNKVTISEPDSKGVVTIAVPEPQIVGETDIDSSSISEVYADTGFLTEVTGPDKAKALEKAQADMKEQALKDDALMRQAETRAKELLEQYVINIGEIQGEKYTVVFTKAE